MKVISISALLAFALALGSCSLINPSSAGKGKTTVATPVSQPAATASADTLSKALAGEWSVLEVAGTKVDAEENVPYVSFVPAENRFYASNGCNILNGSYSLKGNVLTFSNILSTLKMCADAPYESAINAAISEGRPVKALLKEIGSETYLYLNDNSGAPLMTLCRHNMEFLNGQWRVTAIDGKAIDDEEANVFFDIPSLKVHGNTGCNYFNGEILIDPSVPNSISFSGMGVTRMACYKGDQERLMLVALEETVTALPVNKNTVALANADGCQVLTLTRAE